MTHPEWRARWVWLAGAPAPGDTFAFLRRTFDLSSRPDASTVRVTADGRYVLFVNNVEVGRGPIRSEPRHLHYDSYDVAPLLRTGENVIALLARHYGRPTLYWVPADPVDGLGRGGVLCEVDVDGSVAVATDATWRAMRAPYTPSANLQTEGAPDNENIDGRVWPAGWTDAAFDDSTWALVADLGRAVGVGAPFGVLAPRTIEPLAERKIDVVRGLSLKAGEARTLDIGTITNAHVVLDIETQPGTTIDVRAGEDVLDGEPLLDVRDWSLRYTAAGVPGEHTEAFEPIGFRYLRVSADAPARIGVTARERTYPRAPGAMFRCSDPALNAIWEAGARTLDLCSTDAFIDCPSREQRAWLGDDYVNTQISMTVNPDLALVLCDLRLHAAGQRADGLLPMVAAADFTGRAHTLPDCSLLWVSTLARIYEHTGSVELVAELLPVALRILDAFEAMRAPDGLIAGFKHGLEGWVFIDWAQLERGDHIAALDAMFAMALQDAAALPGAPADELRARHASTSDAFERYWDPGRACYVDAAWLDGAVGRRVSQQTNSAAICAGLVPRERMAGVLARITDDARLVRTRTPGDGGTFGERLNRQWERPEGFDDEQNVVLAQPFFAHFLHRAFVASARRDLLVPSILRWSEMVARNGLVEEFWTALPGMGSRCHSWAGTPTYDLVANVLGVRPGAPGWSSVVVDPHLGDLAWAQARIPTPLGWLDVRAEAGRPVEVELPAGARLAAP